VVQPTQAEKNRIGNSMPNLMPRTHPGPVRLYVGSLHYNITEDMLRGIFEPFGKIDSIMLMTDPETGRSKGYGFVTVGKMCTKLLLYRILVDPIHAFTIVLSVGYRMLQRVAL
jgi:RNA-binding protein 39